MHEPPTIRVPALPLPTHPWHPGTAGRPDEPHLPQSIATTRVAVWHGADLFDHGAFWEAHAIWEIVWKARPEGSSAREALQALIQTAAYHLKTEPHLLRAAARLKARALMRLDGVRDRGITRLHGLDLARLRADLARHDVGDAPLRLHGGPRSDTTAPSVEDA